MYTMVPPPAGAPRSVLEACLRSLQENAVPIDALNIPEVHNEGRRPRVTPFIPKMEPRLFGRLAERVLDPPIEVIVDRGIVYTHWHNQEKWLFKTWRDYHIRTVVLVGGESSQIRYPGPSVTEAARLITQCMQALSLGGITIPTRRDEPQRLLEKTRSGIEFFISQVLYEADHMKSLLRDYHRLCLEEDMQPQRIFLSFAPISSAADVKFLKWWGVEFPSETEQLILRASTGILSRSIQVTEGILEDILGFIEAEELRVSIGLNIEHVTTRNIEASIELAARLIHGYETHPQAKSVRV